jgi:NADH:ubiquinone oxidoreductase subunit C
MSIASIVHARLPALRGALRTRRERDVEVLDVPVAHLVTLARFVRDDPDVACDHFVDAVVVDRGRSGSAARFVLVVLLASRAHGTRGRIEVSLDEDEPVYPSLAELWPAALLAERELWEMHGVVAEGHPSLRHVLLPDDFVGHPGRVDFVAPAAPAATPPRAVIEPAAPPSADTSAPPAPGAAR